MLIVCPQCAASYQVSAASLGVDGRSVRCANCHTIWFATPTAEPVLEAAGATDVYAEPDPAADNGYAAGGDIAHQDVFAESPDGMPGDFAVSASDRLDTGDMTSPSLAPQDELSAADITAIPGADDPDAVSDAPSIVPPFEDASAGLRYAAPLPGEDIESLAARREAQRKRRSIWRRFKPRMPSLATTAVLLAGIVLVLFAARTQIVRFAPQTASFYALFGTPVNLRGLDFANIRVTRDMQDGIPVLVVEGKIVSSTNGITEVPRMRFAIHDETGKEIYNWTMMPSRTLLGSGETLPFRSRLASPPAEGRDVSIRFFNRRDAMSTFR